MTASSLLPRLLTRPLEVATRSSPVVVVTGARQTGKSTLVRSVAALGERTYLTLDDLDVLEQAREDPGALVRRAPRLTLDEVQRSPDLLLAIKRAVDERRVPGRFVLTGSANLLLMQRVSESLAGRAVYFSLAPLTRHELRGQGRAGIWSELFETPTAEWPDLVKLQRAEPVEWQRTAHRGGYPVPAYELDDAEARDLWFAGYTRTYLERDLQQLSTIGNLVDFRRLMRAACLRLGNLVNQTELGRDVGLPQPTVRRYLNLLEASYQLVRLPGYAVNRTKRLIKAPKLFWSDAGLALHLAGASEPGGAHLENIVLTDLLAWRGAQLDRPEVLYWRTATGEEVDLVIEWEGRLLPVEVKAGPKPRYKDARHLKSFLAEYPERAPAGLLLHTGAETFWLAEGILATAWWRII